jgi:hypothetical protein
MANTTDLNLMDIKQASKWASRYLGKNVTPSNIAYLIQYGRIKKSGMNSLISKQDLVDYYKSFNGARELDWKNKLGRDIDWALSFDTIKEAETTKHVHRLHPYKGKFIPQLVGYFLDCHTDNFKREAYFKKGDIVLDPFCGSGTTLVEANEQGINAIGIDVSVFNSLISNIKVGKYDLAKLHHELQKITDELKNYTKTSETIKFENELLIELAKFNNRFFPSPEFRYRVNRGQIDEYKYGRQKEKEFSPVFQNLVRKHKIQIKQNKTNSFLDKWYLKSVRDEIDFTSSLVKKIKDTQLKNLITIILSRTIRSCRATTHSDLATLKEPISKTYYCSKHGKICKPLFSILNWWQRYSKDTLERIKTFASLRTNTHQICLTGDSRSIDIFKEIQKINTQLSKLFKRQKIRGIFSSPPYVGMIDYHQQHAYAYELFGFKRRDELEIGPLSKGQGVTARSCYTENISQALKNCKRFLTRNYDVFLVANDKYDIYPQIANNSNMMIVNKYKRPVLNRTEKDKSAYSEIIFHLKEKQ